jgi:hypothetical protein
MELRVYVTVCDISGSNWRDTYEQACLVAKQWTPGPLPIGSDQIAGVSVQQHVLDIETDGKVRIDGEPETRSIGELLALALRT